VEEIEAEKKTSGEAQDKALQVIVLDANILVSAVSGVQVKRVLAAALERGVTLAVPEPQIREAASVLVEKLEYAEADATSALEAITRQVRPLAPEFYAAQERRARERLHVRGQPDWPVLASALAGGAGVWTHDHDFFGVGVPVWSSKNMRYAE
jgi:predicted nucleic acid-binding protein